MSEIKTVLGLMSGTSLDGIDLALLATNGKQHIEPMGDACVTYSAPQRRVLRYALDVAADLPTNVLADMSGGISGGISGDMSGGRAQWPTALVAAEALVTQAHIAAIEDFLRDYPTPQLIGFHGQTLTHRPDEGFTWQIGAGQAIANAIGIDVVGQFRLADMQAGGQGAPLAPLYHAALAGPSRPQAVLNLGGIANLTWLGEGDEILAFDTGPGNALIDDWVQDNTGARFDVDGALAASGEVNQAALAALMAHRYFVTAPPKSLDRLDFDLSPVGGLSPEDGAASLTAFTAASIARALDFCPAKPAQIILSGGGRHNKTLCAMLAAYTDIDMVDADVQGWRGDALEAQLFGWLAVRSIYGLALSRPQTTGVAAPVSGGILYKA